MGGNMQALRFDLNMYVYSRLDRLTQQGISSFVLQKLSFQTICEEQCEYATQDACIW